ncbi:MAG: ABC transporter permease [Oscillospiraceae bacterium]|jgi:ribose/xylose/arabinose/galactoside ABC-type transport system permease subunit|nr:ABC transporter permease [Oscillospiraceae bacterium]
MLKKITKSKAFMLLVLLAVMCVIFSLGNKLYLSPNNLKNIMIASSLSGTVMVGILCLLISGNIDLSAGAVGSMGALVTALLINAGVPWFIALLLCIIFGACTGGVNAFLAYKFGINPFIGTLGMSSVWEGLTYIISGNQSILMSNESFFKVGTSEILGIPLPFLYFAILSVIFGLILYYTKFGREIYMSGGNRMAARLAGVNIQKIGTIMMMNCSAIAAFAGAVLCARMKYVIPASVRGREMDAITSAILGGVSFMGGTGGTGGAFVGLLVLNAFSNGLEMWGVQAYWQIIASNLLLLVALTVDYFNERAIRRNLQQKVG